MWTGINSAIVHFYYLDNNKQPSYLQLDTNA